MVHPPLTRVTLSGALVLATLLVIGGCEAGNGRTAESGSAPREGAAGAERDPDGVGDAGSPADTRTAGAVPPLDTTAEALRAHLTARPLGDREEWYLWPGTGPGDSIPGPHGPRGSTWTNFIARDGLTNGASALSPGAVLALRELAPDGSPAGLLAMYKAEAYRGEDAAWFWASWGPDGELRASGRPGTCLSCHARGRDHVLTAEVGTGEIWDPR